LRCWRYNALVRPSAAADDAGAIGSTRGEGGSRGQQPLGWNARPRYAFPMLEIFVDGDACPVKQEVEAVATRHNLPVHIVSNGGLRPSRNPLVKSVTVAAGADAADDWIAENIGEGDIAITADIPLAARCLKKGARVVSPAGKPFTETGIGMALGMRDLHRHLREVTGGQTYNAGFGKQDRSRFLNALENEIQALRRTLPKG